MVCGRRFPLQLGVMLVGIFSSFFFGRIHSILIFLYCMFTFWYHMLSFFVPSWGLSARGTNISISQASPPPLDSQSNTHNPWSIRAAALQSSSVSSTPSKTSTVGPSTVQAATAFSEILQDEKAKSETLEMAKNRPLALIQVIQFCLKVTWLPVPDNINILIYSHLEPAVVLSNLVYTC